jgi:hypothetical protein
MRYLWPPQDKKDDAGQRLAETSTWCADGFDTKDLQEANALLEQFT